MALPRLQYAFITFGKLKHGSYAIFIFLLITCSYLANRYLGMFALNIALDHNTGALPSEKVAAKRAIEITMKPKGSLIIGGISAINFVHSTYGLLGLILNLPEFQTAPLILLPLSAFFCLFLVFYDLGIKDSAGFLYFYVLTGFICKLILAEILTRRSTNWLQSVLAQVARMNAKVLKELRAFFSYCFLVVYSYYVDETETPEERAAREAALKEAYEEEQKRRQRRAQLPRTAPPTRRPPFPVKITIPSKPVEQKTPPPRPPPPVPSRSPKLSRSTPTIQIE